ncbi:aspartyl-phosphate phosphatase Spo0E family protein [Bacillus sp. P14.5]|uniref:aspartyl-phosphate phosphatase Spo0E family protein n=1 Tax=Bacillus sp. P14.5 TaxID=1983400 RepID=UPI000DEB57F8|nr:aspartyl-phosphate phosphatase Spo0E family protein [Bacillus sp. P14.5]
MLDPHFLKELKEYIHFYQEGPPQIDVCESAYELEYKLGAPIPYSELEEFISTNEQPSFRQELLELIDEKGFTDPEVYKKAGIDRKHFSKIRSKPDYRVGRNTAIALALALELGTDEAEDLLSAAGYSLSFSDTYDLVIRFCLEKEIHDLDYVNQALHSLSLKPLTG